MALRYSIAIVKAITLLAVTATACSSSVAVDAVRQSDRIRGKHSYCRATRHQLCLTDPGMIPINVALSASTSGGVTTVTVSVTVNNVPSGGSYVQVGCNDGSLILPPTGSRPYSLAFADLNTGTESFTVSLSTPSAESIVTFYACPADVDASDSNNWTTSTAITIPSATK